MNGDGLRLVVIGGDAAMWVGLSSTLGDKATQIFVPRDADLQAILGTSGEPDAIVLVATAESDVTNALRMLRSMGLHNRTIMVGDSSDLRLVSNALTTGLGAFVEMGSGPERLAAAVKQVAEGGLFYDRPAATAIRDALSFGSPDKSAGMSVAHALVSALELKDTYTGGHAERVTALAMRLAEAAMLEDAVPSESLEAAFMLHDVGKIGIPESILTKPAGVNEIERRVLQTHPLLGERILVSLDFPEVVMQVVRHHHERWDGTGYPDGLSGYGIPAAARIFSIADVLDAMTSVRPYRRPVSFAQALDEILEHAGTHFDPALSALALETYLGSDLERTFSPISADDR